MDKQLEEAAKEGAEKGREIASQDDFMTVYIDVSLPIVMAAPASLSSLLREAESGLLTRHHRPT